MKQTKEVEAPALFPEKSKETALAANSPAELIRQAVTSGASLDNLEKLLTMQERWESNEARKAYHKAMAAFKANPPEIEKDKRVAFESSKGKVEYNHATLSNVTKKINEALSRHGLSASWVVNQNGLISVTCRITHEQGHHEETTMAAPADNSGSKNAIQSIGSTVTYLERYTLLALTGLAAQEADDDGKATGAAVERISDEEIEAIEEHLQDLNIPIEKFLAYMKIEKLGDMLKSDLPKAKIALENHRAKKAAQK